MIIGFLKIPKLMISNIITAYKRQSKIWGELLKENVDHERSENHAHRLIIWDKGNSMNGVIKVNNGIWRSISPRKLTGIKIDTTGINIIFERSETGTIKPNTFAKTMKLPQKAA